MFLEPVQNAGGCFVPGDGYFTRIREICDRYGVLLVSDEVICAFGRLGDWFGSSLLGYQPDMLTFAKGVTSGYAPLGGLLVSDRIAEPFLEPTSSFLHGITFGGHPVSCAVALANLDVMEAEDLPGRVRSLEGEFKGALDTLLDLPIVSEVRGKGFFYGIEMSKNGRAVHRRRVRVADPRLPVEPAARARAHLPGRRPRRPGDPAVTAARVGPRGVRVDRRHHPPDPAGGVERARRAVSDPAGGAELDEIDRAIIRVLQADGRTPYSKLGPNVGLSQAAVRQRVQRLIDRGVMQIVAVTDPAMLGLGIQAMVGVRIEGDVRAAADAVAEVDGRGVRGHHRRPLRPAGRGRGRRRR